MRPTVAKWLRDTSLGTKLSSLIALIVVAVVTSVAYLEVQSFEQHIEADLMDSARLGAQSAADNLAQRSVPFDSRDVQDSLHDLVAADPVIDAISVIHLDETGQPGVATSTSTEERAEVVDLAATLSPAGRRSPSARLRRLRSRCRFLAEKQRRGRHRRPGEPAADANPRAARRPRVRPADHRAGHDPRSRDGQPVPGKTASRGSCARAGRRGKET